MSKSTTHGPLVLNRRDAFVPCSISISRSPSRAMVPRFASISMCWSGLIICQSLMGTLRIIPGAMGAVMSRFPGFPGLGNRMCSPLGSSMDMCFNLAPMDAIPMVDGSARVKNTECRVSTSHSARAPTNVCLEMAASTRAMSFSFPLTMMSIFLDRRWMCCRICGFWATVAAAIPASVPSISLGNTLFVPVDTGAMGTSPHPLATSLLVPSPPRVTMHFAPAFRMICAATVESCWFPVGV